MTRSKAVTKTPLSAEGLLALSDRLFTPNLKPPRVIAVPRASSIARSKLSPPWAEIDERPTRRVRRFRLWRDNAPSLRKAVLDPKRRCESYPLAEAAGGAGNKLTTSAASTIPVIRPTALSHLDVWGTSDTCPAQPQAGPGQTATQSPAHPPSNTLCREPYDQNPKMGPESSIPTPAAVQVDS